VVCVCVGEGIGIFVHDSPTCQGANANVNGRNLSGQTPLHLAVARHHLSVIDLLLKHGANVNALDLKGRSVEVGASWQLRANTLIQTRVTVRHESAVCE
jgi:hypothetical protein